MKPIASLILLVTPFAALAAPPSGNADFAAGANLPAKIVIDDSLWRCEAGRCSGPAEERKVAVQKICKDLARKVGAVEALSVGKTTLAAEDLTACNKGAKGAPS